MYLHEDKAEFLSAFKTWRNVLHVIPGGSPAAVSVSHGGHKALDPLPLAEYPNTSGGQGMRFSTPNISRKHRLP